MAAAMSPSPEVPKSKGGAPSAHRRPGKDAGVLIYSGKKFAVGLLWLTGDEASSGLSNASAAVSRARIARIKPDFICERVLIFSQSGFGHLAKGHRMGMPVAAAAAADILVGEWHGVFKGDNGWWYVAVHGDAIAPEGDILFTSEESAYEHFVAQLEAQKWPKSYAPAEWMIAGTNSEVTLEKLLSHEQTVFLRPQTLDSFFGNIQNKFITLTLLGALLVMLVPFYTTSLNLYGQPLSLPMRIVQPIVYDDPKLQVPPKYIQSGLLSSKLLEIVDFPAPLLIRTCLEYFSDVFVALPGWEIMTVSCAGGSVQAEWEQRTARLADLVSLRRYFGNEATMLYDGQKKLQMSQRLSIGDVQPQKMVVLQKEQIFALLTARLESKGKIEISMADNISSDPSTPSARILKFKFATPLPAYLWANDFDIPALKPDILSWSVKSSEWTLEGTVKYQ